MRAVDILFVGALAMIGSAAVADPPGDAPPVAQPAGRPYAAYVTDAAQRFALPESWIWAVMQTESGGDPRALSTAGARGLMQIMPTTWAALTARHGLGSDPYDVRANIRAGAAYLREMLDRYGDLATALAAYNAGPGRVDDWRSGTRALPAATRAYVDRIAASVSPSALPLASAASVPPLVTWRNAGLFIVRGDGASTGTATAASVPPVGSEPVLPLPVSAPLPPLVHALFVPLSGRSAQ